MLDMLLGCVLVGSWIIALLSAGFVLALGLATLAVCAIVPLVSDR